MSQSKTYLEWRRRGSVGCMFARMIAGKPRRYRQILYEVGAGNPKVAAVNIAKRIEALVSDPTVSAAVLLLPKVRSLETLLSIALALRDQPKWDVTMTTLANPPAGPMVSVHIIRAIPFGDATCPSEVLVLGPFHEFPNTRRAPLVAMELYVGEPRPEDPKTLQPTKKANLAHIEMNLPTHHTFQSVWEKSEKGRLASLGGIEDSRAKAKISFVVPLTLAQKHRCAP
jgi:hypothetical protein